MKKASRSSSTVIESSAKTVNCKLFAVLNSNESRTLLVSASLIILSLSGKIPLAILNDSDGLS